MGRIGWLTDGHSAALRVAVRWKAVKCCLGWESSEQSAVYCVFTASSCQAVHVPMGSTTGVVRAAVLLRVVHLYWRQSAPTGTPLLAAAVQVLFEKQLDWLCTHRQWLAWWYVGSVVVGQLEQVEVLVPHAACYGGRCCPTQFPVHTRVVIVDVRQRCVYLWCAWRMPVPLVLVICPRLFA